MFDHLDTLDDAAPPAGDEMMLAHVRDRAAGLRRRVRLARTGAIFAILAVASGIVAVSHRSARHVQVILRTEPNPVVEGRLANGMRAKLTLLTPSVQLGDDLDIRVVVTNTTNKPGIIGVGTVPCALRLGPVLRDANENVAADRSRTGPCDEVGRSLAAGASATFTTSLSTQLVRLPPNAPHARYSLRLETGGSHSDPPAANSVGPIAVEVRAPDITAQLIVPITEVHPTGTILGTLELDNQGAAVHVLCPDVSYLIGLYVNGELIEPGLGLDGRRARCRNISDRDIIGTGLSRHRFSVYAQYDSCTSARNAHPHAPSCGSPPMIPPLPAGRYEIRFRGMGPLASVHASPVPIDVIPFGPVDNAGLPKIAGDNSALARDQFEQLYYAPGSAATVALADRGATVTGIYSSGDRVVIQIAPGPGAEAAITLIRSLFVHPELVTVSSAAPTPQ